MIKTFHIYLPCKKKKKKKMYSQIVDYPYKMEASDSVQELQWFLITVTFCKFWGFFTVSLKVVSHWFW